MADDIFQQSLRNCRDHFFPGHLDFVFDRKNLTVVRLQNVCLHFGDGIVLK